MAGVTRGFPKRLGCAGDESLNCQYLDLLGTVQDLGVQQEPCEENYSDKAQHNSSITQTIARLALLLETGMDSPQHNLTNAAKGIVPQAINVSNNASRSIRFM